MPNLAMATVSQPIMSDDSKFSSFDNICATQDSDPPTPPSQPSRAPIIIFGSQGADFLWAFDPILHLADRQPELASFLSLALDAIRVELGSVANRQNDGSPTTEAQRETEVELLAILPPFEPFSDVRSLVNFHRRTGLKDPAINGVLLCMLQTACVVAVYCAAQRSNIDNEDAQAVLCNLKQAWKAVAQPCSHLLGFCTGALSAFTIRQVFEEPETAGPFNIWNYVREAIQAIRVCFWISLRSAQARTRLTEHSGPLTSFDHWSVAVSFKGQDGAERVCQCLTHFNILEQKRSLDASVPLTITARAMNQISIGGPPQSLERFMAHLSEQMGGDARAFPLEIYSPYHTPDFEQEAKLVMLDLERRGVIDDADSPFSQKKIWETASANILSETSLRGATRVLVDSNLCSTADWDTMVDRLLLLEGELPSSTQNNRGVIVSFGPGANLAFDLTKRFSLQSGSPSASETTTLLDVPVLLREMLRHDLEMLGPERRLPHPDVAGDEVVIVSMACRFPGHVRTPEQLWTCLETGRSTVTEIPKHLFDIDAYYGEGPNRTLARHMHALPENVVKSMDARLFSMSPKEIEQLDPQHRLVMLCSYEALERAGYSAEPNSPSSFDGKRIAVCMGASWDDYRENASWNIGSYFITGNIRAFIPGHVSFSLNWEGPSVSVDSLECSAVSAIQWSRRALLSGQCDVALAGAVNVLTQPQMFIAMDKQGILSRSGTNATFSSKLDGKTRGDGCGVLLLKRRSTAIRDGDRILATLPAARTTYHGQPSDREAVNFQQSDFLTRVVSEAGLEPSDLVHIEASGFHTKAGEAAEFDSFARLLSHTAHQSSRKQRRVSVASLRPNIGAGEAVSTMASVMKAVLILNKGSIPRQVSISHASELQPDIAATCSASKLFVPTEAKLLPPSTDRSDRRHILVNSLASTGCHGVVLVGSATSDERERFDGPATSGKSVLEDKCSWVFMLSAKTKESAEMLKKSLIDYLQRDVCLADLSYTLACRRTHYPFRLSVVASDQDELIRRLRGTEFVEAKPATDLPPFNFHFRWPKGVSTPEDTSFFSSSWGMLNRYETFVANMSSFGDEQEEESLYLMQTCIASLFEDCGVSPTVNTSLRFPAAWYLRGLIDTETMLKASRESDLDKRQNMLCRAQRFSPSVDDGSDDDESEGEPSPGKKYCSVVMSDKVELLGGERSDVENHQVAHTNQHVLQTSVLSTLSRLHQQGYNIRWIEYFRPYLPYVRHIDTLPTYPFHLQQFWMEYHDRNLIQHDVPELTGASAAHGGEADAREETAGEDDDFEEPEEPLTQPLLTTQVVADSNTRIYVSNLKDETQAALVLATSPSVIAIELMVEAAIEASASSNAMPGGIGDHTLVLSDVDLYFQASDLLTAQDVRLAVALPDQCQGRQAADVQLHFDAQPDVYGECTYAWHVKKDLYRRWAKLQSLLREKISNIKAVGEMLDAKLVYKSINGGGDAKSSKLIRSAYFDTQTREVVFCIDAKSHDDSSPSEGQCMYAMVLSTLEECASWHRTTFDAQADGEFRIASIGELVADHEWLNDLNRTGRATRSYMAFVTTAQSVGVKLIHKKGSYVDILLIDDDGQLVGELSSVMVNKAKSEPSKMSSKPAVIAAPPIATKSQPTAPTVPVSTTHGVEPQRTAKKPSSTKRSSAAEDVHVKIIAVLASELGITVEEMKPSVKFADLGLDSLMSLVCISTLETLNLGFEIPQSLFLERDSPGELLAWIKEQVGDAGADDDIAESEPDLGSAADAVTEQVSVKISESIPAETFTQAPPALQASQSGVPAKGSSAVDKAMKTITSTIETELGVVEGSIAPDANLADLGMDSLMSLLVLGNLSGMLSFELPSSLFMDCTSLLEIHAFLAHKLGGSEATNDEPAQQAAAPTQLPAQNFIVPPAKQPTLLRKGTDFQPLPPLFLLPDGSGMSTVYQFIHPIDRPIYSINSPFLADASAWNGGITQIAHYYLACIKLVQPEGPWLVGGWSFGGMVAFEIARILVSTPGGAENDRIAGLFLLDSPSPGYPPLPMSIVDWIFTAPELKDIAPPALSEKLIAHFKATVESLVGWSPTLLAEVQEQSKVPKTWYIVADQRLPGRIEDIKEVNETVRWLFRSHRAAQSGPDGWEKLIPSHKITVKPLDEANHFTMVREPNVGRIAQMLQEACRQALQP